MYECESEYGGGGRMKVAVAATVHSGDADLGVSVAEDDKAFIRGREGVSLVWTSWRSNPTQNEMLVITIISYCSHFWVLCLPFLTSLQHNS